MEGISREGDLSPRRDKRIIERADMVRIAGERLGQGARNAKDVLRRNQRRSLIEERVARNWGYARRTRSRRLTVIRGRVADFMNAWKVEPTVCQWIAVSINHLDWMAA